MKDGNVYFIHSPFTGNRTKRATVCGIYNPETGEMNFGVSVCSELDNFSRKDGRARAEIRAKVPMVKISKSTIDELKTINATDKNLAAFLSIAPSIAHKALVGGKIGGERDFKKYDGIATTTVIVQ